MDYQQALKNPGKLFGGVPEAVEASVEFDAAQKRAILMHWKDQLIQLQRATDENMPGPESDGGGADCLRRVVSALTRLSGCLPAADLDHFAGILAERQRVLGEEIRRVLARTQNERYADILAGGGDAGDTSVADLLSDIAFAEVARDAAEIRDIQAAQARIAAGTYGVCMDCGRPIGKARLEAYPTAKRCIQDQERHERLRRR
jgi:RNA polymerase-binding protein DksA